MALSTFTLLCSHYHHISPEPLHHLKLKLYIQETINNSPLPPFPQVLATTILLSVSKNLTIRSQSPLFIFLFISDFLPTRGRWIGKKLIRGKETFIPSNILTMLRKQTFLTSTHRLT